MQLLTLKAVRAAARKYYKARKLTAQHRSREKRLCEYKVGSYRCAIGAALTQETLSRMLVGSGPADVIEILPHEKDSLNFLQKAHDEWARASRMLGANDSYTRKARNEFLELIGLRKKKKELEEW